MWHGFFCCLKISPHGRQILWQHGWMIALTSLSMQTLHVMSDWLGVGSACSSAAWVDSSSTSPLTSSISLSLSESTSPVSLNLLVCRLAMASTYFIGVMGVGLPVSRCWMSVSILLLFALGLWTRLMGTSGSNFDIMEWNIIQAERAKRARLEVWGVWILSFVRYRLPYGWANLAQTCRIGSEQ